MPWDLGGLSLPTGQQLLALGGQAAAPGWVSPFSKRRLVVVLKPSPLSLQESEARVSVSSLQDESV